jgi:hypothetical protein
MERLVPAIVVSFDTMAVVPSGHSNTCGDGMWRGGLRDEHPHLHALSALQSRLQVQVKP